MIRPAVVVAGVVGKWKTAFSFSIFSITALRPPKAQNYVLTKQTVAERRREAAEVEGPAVVLSGFSTANFGRFVSQTQLKDLRVAGY
jgi:hypothetical protein